MLFQLPTHGDGGDDETHASHCGDVAVFEKGATSPCVEVSFELNTNDDLKVTLQLIGSASHVMRRRLSEYDRFHSRTLSSEEMARVTKEAALYHSGWV